MLCLQVRREYPELSFQEAIGKWLEVLDDYSEDTGEAACEGLSNEQLGVLWLAREVSVLGSLCTSIKLVATGWNPKLSGYICTWLETYCQCLPAQKCSNLSKDIISFLSQDLGLRVLEGARGI